MNLGTVRSFSRTSLFHVRCRQRFKYHKSRAIWRVFCFPDVYSWGGRVMLDRVKATPQCSRHSSAHSGRCTSGSWKLRYLWIICDCLQLDHRAAHLGHLCKEIEITPKPRFSPRFSLLCYMGREVLHDLAYSSRCVTMLILNKLHGCHGNVLSCA